MGIVDDAQTFLRDEGIVDGSTGWPSVQRRVHDQSDRLVVLTEDGGLPPEIPAEGGIGSAALGTPAVQIRIRGGPWEGTETQAKAEEILRALHGNQSLVIDGTTYRSVAAQTDEPVFMGFDDNGRPEHTVSIHMTRAVPAPST